MNDKLSFIKNLLSQIDELTLKQKELQQAKDQINLTGHLDLRGEIEIGNLLIPLNDLAKEVPSTIASNFRMVISQYIEYLIQKNGHLQQDLLSNIHIAHIQDTPLASSGEITPAFSDEKKNFSELNKLQQIKPFVSKEEIFKSSEELSTETLKEEEQEKITINTSKEIKVTQEELPSRLEQINHTEEIRKLIAGEFYSLNIGEYIQPEEILARITEKTDKKVTLDEINDVAWVLIAQGVFQFFYHSQCNNGHDEYLLPPLPNNIVCTKCHEKVLNVNVSYKKIV